MRIKILGTGSSGNCYVIENQKNRLLLLDLGLKKRIIERGIDYRIADIDCAIVSHIHKDHALSEDDFYNMGIEIFNPYRNPEKPFDKITVGDYKIQSFDLPHNGTTNRGFLIDVDGERILYATDFEYCKYRFKGVNHMIVECNYQKAFVDSDIPNYEHKVRGHCELSTCKGFVEATANDSLKSVVLIHMGRDSLDYRYAVETIKEVVNDNTKVFTAWVTNDFIEL